MCPLHGIYGASDLWHERIDKRNIEEMHVKSFRLDRALNFIFEDGKLKGLSENCV